jgi:hypothetical protein
MIVAVAAQNLDDVAAVLRNALADDVGKRGLGEVMAELLEAVTVRHADRQLAAIALMVWSEALRNPRLAERLREAIATMSGDMAELIRGPPAGRRLRRVTRPGHLVHPARLPVPTGAARPRRRRQLSGRRAHALAELTVAETQGTGSRAGVRLRPDGCRAGLARRRGSSRPLGARRRDECPARCLTVRQCAPSWRSLIALARSMAGMCVSAQSRRAASGTSSEWPRSASR